MPRRHRYCPPGMPMHIIQRGNNRQVCFTSNKDMAAYANWLKEAAEKYGLEIHAWVFMTNHIHLLATPEHPDAVSLVMQYLGRLYVRYFNNRYNRTGTLFEGRFKACPVQQDGYFLVCQRYIELNPVRAHMVNDPAEYVWSSYRTHCFGETVDMWSPHSQYTRLDSDPMERQRCYRELFNLVLEETVIAEIRHAVNTGFVLGTEKFKRQVEQLTGKRQQLLKRGPKKKRKNKTSDL